MLRSLHSKPNPQPRFPSPHLPAVAMLRTIPRRLPLAPLSRAPRALSVLQQCRHNSSSSKRNYATETSMPPSANDVFATGNNAYYAEE